MATAQLGAVLRHIRNLADDRKLRDQTDGALLRAFLSRRDQTAFEALLRRHGPMVLRVCQRTLGNPQDAEDVLQATFLVLARQATSIRKRESLASWLHGVAHRMATRARRAAGRRHKHESQASRIELRDPALCAAWQELQVLLDEEIGGLPEALRGPFVYCCLENKSSAEAGRQLGIEETAVRKRLSRARKFLQERLTRRGISLATLLAAVGVETNEALAAVPRSVVVSTAQAAAQVAAGQAAAAGLVSTKVAALAEGMVKTMFVTKLKTAAVVVLALVLTATGTGTLAYCTVAVAQPGGPTAASLAPTDGDEERTAKLIQQLGSDSFADREKATQELEQIGPAALDALRRATRGDDPERKRRAEELVQKIEKRALEASLLAPKRVRLAYKDTPLAEALADFQKQSGYDLTLSDPEAKLRDRTVTLNTGDVTFWQALDQFCHKAGLIESTPQPADVVARGELPPYPRSPDPQADQQQGAARPGGALKGNGIILADGKAVQTPTDDSTSVRVRAEVPGKTADGSEILQTMRITPEPKLRGADIAAVRIERAIDNRGQSLEPVLGNDVSAPPVKEELPPLPAFPRPPSGAAGSVRHDPGLVRLKRSTTTATSLSELSGTITIRVLQGPESASKVVTLDMPFTLKNISLP